MKLHYRMVMKYALFCVLAASLSGCDDSITVQGSEAMAIEKPGCYKLRFIVQTSDMESASTIALEKGRMPTAVENETDCRDEKTQSREPYDYISSITVVDPSHNESFTIDTQRWFPTSGCYLISVQMPLRDDVSAGSPLLSRKPEDLSLSTQLMYNQTVQQMPLAQCYDQKS